jgi:hypothetical protein
VSAPIATPAELARSLATALRVGPLAAGASSMGPLATRAGYRGGPEAAARDPRLMEQVCIGFVAGAAPRAVAPATLLVAVSPIHKGVRALVESGCALAPLEVAALAALRAGAQATAHDLHTRLNAAASDLVAETWSLACVEGALARLTGLGFATRDQDSWCAHP